MNQQDTIDLFKRCEAARKKARAVALAEGKEVEAAEGIAHQAAKSIWNEWAHDMLARRKALEEAGERATEEYCRGNIEVHNEETHAWMGATTVDFSGIRLQSCQLFGKWQPNSGEIMEDSDIDPVSSANSVLLEGKAIRFDGFVFPGAALFDMAQFHGSVRFDGAQFRGHARFDGVQFRGGTRFDGAQFSGATWFFGVQFRCVVRFNEAWFRGDALFDMAQFHGSARFDMARFHGSARFNEAQFHEWASFDGMQFSDYALFFGTQFRRVTRFNEAQFSGAAWFDEAQFSGAALFMSAKFAKDAQFFMTKFDQFASFEDARFCKGANFGAIRGERGFSLANVTFERVPDFIQAHFEEAPRLDNIHVRARIVDLAPEPLPTPDASRWGTVKTALSHAYLTRFGHGVLRRIFAADSDVPARFRALKRLAIQGHDADREHEFFASEVRAARFTCDWPLPLVRLKFTSCWLKPLNWLPFGFWSGSSWSGFGRFWFGLGYEVFGGLGASALRPTLWWLTTIAVAAVFFLGESPDMSAARATLREGGASRLASYAETTARAWGEWRHGQGACYAPPAPADVKESHIGSLSADVRSSTSAVSEALQLAFRNAFIVLDSSGDAAHRAYGCLYGGSEPIAVVPGSVSAVAAIQKVCSATFIFLFGLALRNMLKMK